MSAAYRGTHRQESKGLFQQQMSTMVQAGLAKRALCISRPALGTELYRPEPWAGAGERGRTRMRRAKAERTARETSAHAAARPHKRERAPAWTPETGLAGLGKTARAWPPGVSHGSKAEEDFPAAPSPLQ